MRCVDSIVKAKPAAAKGKYLEEHHGVIDDGPGRERSTRRRSNCGVVKTLMAVTRADKVAELQLLETAFQGIGDRDPRRLQGAQRSAGH